MLVSDSNPLSGWACWQWPLFVLYFYSAVADRYLLERNGSLDLYLWTSVHVFLYSDILDICFEPTLLESSHSLTVYVANIGTIYGGECGNTSPPICHQFPIFKYVHNPTNINEPSLHHFHHNQHICAAKGRDISLLWNSITNHCTRTFCRTHHTRLSTVKFDAIPHKQHV